MCEFCTEEKEKCECAKNADGEIRSVEFGEELLGNPEALRSALFEDENDPRSNSYRRNLIRPDISFVRIALMVVLPIIAAAFLCYFLGTVGVPLWVSAVLAAVLLLAYTAVNLKRACICLVKLYQRFAPAYVRNKCRFEPSCSQYMILAIEKYGVFRGIAKGADRLRRCNTKDGGFDYP